MNSKKKYINTSKSFELIKAEKENKVDLIKLFIYVQFVPKSVVFPIYISGGF